MPPDIARLYGFDGLREAWEEPLELPEEQSPPMTTLSRPAGNDQTFESNPTACLENFATGGSNHYSSDAAQPSSLSFPLEPIESSYTLHEPPGTPTRLLGFGSPALGSPAENRQGTERGGSPLRSAGSLTPSDLAEATHQMTRLAMECSPTPVTSANLDGLDMPLDGDVLPQLRELAEHLRRSAAKAERGLMKEAEEGENLVQGPSEEKGADADSELDGSGEGRRLDGLSPESVAILRVR
eukprot:scaffold215221_cov46-Prasinocladus_malaysianus.AAC.1